MIIPEWLSLFLILIGLLAIAEKLIWLTKFIVYRLKLGNFQLDQEQLQIKILKEESDKVKEENKYLQDENRKVSKIILSLMEKKNA